jgi:ppGpp synthetase/RelA/SpoT-type nucleotidyltranferase
LHAAIDFGALEKEYLSVKPVAESFRRSFVAEIETLLRVANVALGSPVQYRVKSWESIAEKLPRLNLSLESIRNLKDLIGIRIMPLYLRDLRATCRIIEQSVQILERSDSAERLESDQFGYASIHYLVKLPES